MLASFGDKGPFGGMAPLDTAAWIAAAFTLTLPQESRDIGAPFVGGAP
jgi:hypothetical protein